MQHLSVKSKTFALWKVKIGDMLGTALSMVQSHHVRLEGDFFNVVISVLLLEGIGRALWTCLKRTLRSSPVKQIGQFELSKWELCFDLLWHASIHKGHYQCYIRLEHRLLCNNYRKRRQHFERASLAQKERRHWG